MVVVWGRKAIWVLWFLGVLGTFGALEAWNYEDGVTLSRFVADMSEGWALFGPLVGVIVGVLLAHFFWPWKHPGIKP